MDRDEIQDLGFFGIVKESFDILKSSQKIFTKITLSMIIPLSFVYLAHIQIQELLFSKIMHNEYILDRTPEGTRSYDRISNILSSEWSYYFLFKIGYLIFFIILMLLSTSAVVYTIACIYTAKELTLRKVMSVVPIVWKRLMITFIWSFVFIFVYNIVSAIVFIPGAFFLGPIPVIGVLFFAFFTIFYLIGMVYITIVWHLASVVSVLEDSYGLNAMYKSRDLVKGKMGICVAVFLMLGLILFGIQFFFEFFVVMSDGGVGKRVLFGLLGLNLMSVLTLFGLVAQTVIYFVCKSYHHESIDKSSLSNHLGGYLGEYVPLKNKDIQLEHFEV